MSRTVTNLITASMVDTVHLTLEHIHAPKSTTFKLFLGFEDSKGLLIADTQDEAESRDQYGVNLEVVDARGETIYYFDQIVSVSEMPSFFFSSDMLKQYGEEEGTLTAIETFMMLACRACIYTPEHYSRHGLNFNRLEQSAPTIKVSEGDKDEELVLVLSIGSYLDAIEISAHHFIE